MRIAILYFVLLPLCIWSIWASFSTAGLYTLKEINPEYPHPNKNVAYLIARLDRTDQTDFLDPDHVSACSLYMPNWKKAADCVRVRSICEYSSPKKKLLNIEVADTRSKEYRQCVNLEKPSVGPIEMLRVSRTLWRYGIAVASIWAAGGFEQQENGQADWEEKHQSWTKPIMEWSEKGL